MMSSLDSLDFYAIIIHCTANRNARDMYSNSYTVSCYKSLVIKQQHNNYRAMHI